MKRVLPLAVFAVAIVGVTTWRVGAGPGDRHDAGRISTEAPLGAMAGEAVSPDTQPVPLVVAPAVTGAESPVKSSSGEDQFVARPDAPLNERATGTAVAWRAPAHDTVVALSPGAPPANSEVDPATGVIVVREIPDDGAAAVSATGSIPGGVEIEPATGAAIAR